MGSGIAQPRFGLDEDNSQDGRRKTLNAGKLKPFQFVPQRVHIAIVIYEDSSQDGLVKLKTECQKVETVPACI